MALVSRRRVLESVAATGACGLVAACHASTVRPTAIPGAVIATFASATPALVATSTALPSPTELPAPSPTTVLTPFPSATPILSPSATPIRSPAPVPQPSASQLSYQAVQQHYFVPDVSLYRETYPNTGNPYSHVWPLSQAFAMTNDMAGLPKVGATYSSAVSALWGGLAKYYSANGRATNYGISPNYASPPGYDSYVNPPYGESGDKFYDDNDWIGLDFIQQYLMTGTGEALAKAEEIFQLEIVGWDTDPSHPYPGGIFWTQASWSQDRNTVSNAPAAELGFHLYLITKEETYLDWAMRMYDWVNSCMVAPNGLYYDHVNLAGTIDQTIWSYNQGTMIGANVLLYRIAGDRTYLSRAERIADAAVTFYDSGGRLWTQDPVFNAILFRNLLQLEAANGSQKYDQLIQSYADQVWQIRDAQTGLFVWAPNMPLDMIQQAAMVQILALLAWDKKDYQKIT